MYVVFLSCAGWVRALPESAAYVWHPAMVGFDSKDLPTWEHILKEGRKTYTPGPGRKATNGSVLLSQHLGGVYDHLLNEHLKYVCDEGASKCKRKVCAMARGSWCKKYYEQDPIPWKPAPRGDKECPKSKYGICNGVGTCQYDIGVCLCPAGWRGDDCGTRDPRPCTHRMRTPALDGENTEPVSHVGPDGRDRNWSVPGWTASRCAGPQPPPVARLRPGAARKRHSHEPPGPPAPPPPSRRRPPAPPPAGQTPPPADPRYCDEDLAMCYCPPGTKYGREPAPAGSPPGTPPVKVGRPMGDSCKPNRCSGHGDCHLGFCRCHEGWYGMDCSRQRASAKTREKGYHEPGGARPYLEHIVVDPPAAKDPPPSPTRRRPLIYVYDTDPLFNSKMMQYRIAKSSCVYRLFGYANESNFNSYVYSLESYFIEQLSISQHRTYDPEEADFFFVPVQLTCYLWPVLGWADHPWFGMPAGENGYGVDETLCPPFWGEFDYDQRAGIWELGVLGKRCLARPGRGAWTHTAHSRAQQGTYMYLKAKRWVQQHYLDSSGKSFWDRRGGRDHIFMMLNDEGACWMPQEVYNTSIVLTHWGRMDNVHVCGSAWGYDNYSAPLDSWKPYVDGDWRKEYDGHPCYTPGKDLVVPSLKPPSHYASSPLLGAPPLERDILLYLRGDTGPYRAHWYSRGIRQRLAKLAYKHNWADKYRIYIGEGWQISGSYSEHLARSTFCVVAPGDGWSARAEDAILHGCIPLVIMDGVHAVFESIVEWDAFAVRIREEAVNEDLPKFLLSFSPEQIERMQRRLALVWHRFAYAQGSLLHAQLQSTYGHNRAARRAAHRPAAGLADEAIVKASKNMAESLGHAGLDSAAAGGGAADDGGGADWYGEWQLRRMWPSFPEDVAQEVEHLATRQPQPWYVTYIPFISQYHLSLRPAVPWQGCQQAGPPVPPPPPGPTPWPLLLPPLDGIATRRAGLHKD
eukprot:XP_001696764.1 exostosin-like glycosyltransferase [Chlamydomonas reinhardtii]